MKKNVSGQGMRCQFKRTSRTFVSDGFGTNVAADPRLLILSLL